MKPDPTIMVLATVQSYMVLLVILVIFVCAPRWPCSDYTHLVFFLDLSATGGDRAMWIVFTVFCLVIYTPQVIIWARKARRKAAAKRPARSAPRAPTSQPDARLSAAPALRVLDIASPARLEGSLLVWTVPIIVMAVLTGANTELMRRANGVPFGDWGFGQLLALALVAPSVWQGARAYINLVRARFQRPRPRSLPTNRSDSDGTDGGASLLAEDPSTAELQHLVRHAV
jgi:hypothetical protein